MEYKDKKINKKYKKIINLVVNKLIYVTYIMKGW